MKTTLNNARKSTRASRRPLLLIRTALSAILLLGACNLPLCQAALPEPDNIVYGHIWFGTNRVTAADTNVVVEARHPGRTNILASYRMGREPSYGNVYVVEIRLATGELSAGVPAPTNGSVLDIVVMEGAVERARTNFTVGGPTLAERGYVQQIDFGTANLAGFDAWLARYKLDADSGSQDSDHDGSSNYNEYLAGTVPTNPASLFVLRITRTNGNSRVSFDAVPATGVGYENLTRHYALEQKTDPMGTNWQTVAGFSDITAAGQEVVYVATPTGQSGYYRGRVWLGDAATTGLPQVEFQLVTKLTAGQLSISFTAGAAAAQGQNNYYTLEQSTDLKGGVWTAVPGCSNLLGAGQTVTYTVSPGEKNSVFYRGHLQSRSP